MEKITFTKEMLSDMPIIVRAEAKKSGSMQNGEIFAFEGNTYTVYVMNKKVEGLYRYFVFDEVDYFPMGHPMTDEFFDEYFRLLPN